MADDPYYVVGKRRRNGADDVDGGYHILCDRDRACDMVRQRAQQHASASDQYVMATCTSMDAADQIKSSGQMPDNAVGVDQLPLVRVPTIEESGAVTTGKRSRATSQRRGPAPVRENLVEFVSEFARILQSSSLSTTTSVVETAHHDSPQRRLHILVTACAQGWCLFDTLTQQPRFGKNAFYTQPPADIGKDPTLESVVSTTKQMVGEVKKWTVQASLQQAIVGVHDYVCERHLLLPPQAAGAPIISYDVELLIPKHLEQGFVEQETAGMDWLAGCLHDDVRWLSVPKKWRPRANVFRAYAQRAMATRPQYVVRLSYRFRKEHDNKLLRLLDEFMQFKVAGAAELDAANLAFENLYAKPLQSSCLIVPPVAFYRQHQIWLKRFQANSGVVVAKLFSGDHTFPQCNIRRKLKTFHDMVLMDSEHHVALLADLGLSDTMLELALELLILNDSLEWILQLPLQLRRSVIVRLRPESQLLVLLDLFRRRYASDMLLSLQAVQHASTQETSELPLMLAIFGTDLLMSQHLIDSFQGQCTFETALPIRANVATADTVVHEQS